MTKKTVETFAINEPVEVTINCVDCITGMSELADGSVDAIVTSPPYNIGIKYGSYDDTLSREEYLDWTDKWGMQVARILSEEGSFFLNVGSKPTDPTVPFQILEVMLRHFKLQNTIHWVKSIAIMKSDVGNYPGIIQDSVVGHYKPINSERFLNDCHEYIFHLTKTSEVKLNRLAVGVPYQDKSNVSRWNSGKSDLHCRGNTWFLPYETIQSRNKERPHPATFPVELPKRCLKLHGVEKLRMVVDPFLGIGSTALACADLGVPFTGYELDPDYFEESCRRLTNQTKHLKINS